MKHRTGQMAPTAPIEVKPISAEELDFEGDLASQLEQQVTPQEVQRDQEDIQRLPGEERVGQEPFQAEPIEGAGREAVAPGGMVQEQGQEVAPVARTEAGSKRAYDFDDTLYDPKTKKLTPLGEEVKARIAAGEDVTIVTARNSRQTGDITKALGISKGKIQATGSEAKKGEVLDNLGIDRNDYYDADQAKMQAIQTKAEPVAEVETIVEEPAVTPEVKAPATKPTAEAPAVATMQPVTAEQKAAVITGDEISFNYKSPIGGEPIQYTGKVVSEGKDATTGLRKLFVETEVEGTVERLPVFERDIVAKKTAEPAVEAAAPKAAKPTDRKKASSKGIRFEKGKKLTEEEKKEVYRTITDSYKELDRPWELETRFSESSGRDYEARVWIGEPKDYMVKSDVTGRLLRYYIIMPDGTIAHPTEVFPNVSSSEMKIVQDNIESHDAEASRKMDNMVSQLDKSGETDKVVKAIDKAIENGAVFEKQYDGNDKGKRDADVRLRFPNGRSQSIAEYVIRTTGSLLGITESELAEHRTGEKVNPILNRQPDWEQFHANQKAAAPKAEEAKPKTSPKKTANRIRQAKIDTKGKAFDATIGLPIALWNQAIEMVALAVEGGMALADAIKKGIDFINKQQAGKKWNEDEFRKKVQGSSVKQEGRPRRVVTMFSGAGTMEAALSNAESVMAVEYTPEYIEAYNNAFGLDYKPKDVTTVDPQEVIDANPDIFHASPVCKNFSAAKSKKTVEKTDMDSANAVARVITEAKPPVVTIENVPQYEGTVPFQTIIDALEKAGYTFDVAVYNAADFGGVQNRKRLLIRAVKDGELPPVPQKQKQGDWYDAVKDLIDAAPDAPFKSRTGEENWEQQRVKEMVKQGKLDPTKPIITMGGSAFKGEAAASNAGNPSPTLKSTSKEVPRIIMPDGRVKRVTPEMMKRIMGLPDSYALPENSKVAKEVLGNGIDGAFTKALIQPLVDRQVATEEAGKVSPQSEVKAALDKMKNAWADWLGSGMGAMAAALKQLHKRLQEEADVIIEAYNAAGGQAGGQKYYEGLYRSGVYSFSG